MSPEQREDSLVARVNRGVEAAQAYLAIRQITDLSDFQTLFTTVERNRLAAVRDLLLADVKRLV